MNIYDVLAKDSNRLSCGDKWLVIHTALSALGSVKIFEVYERPYHAKKTKELYIGLDEDMACRYLIDGEELKCPPCPQ